MVFGINFPFVARTIVRHMVRPIPMPFRESPLAFGVEGLPSKITGSLSSGIPLPKSRTSKLYTLIVLREDMKDNRFMRISVVIGIFH